MAAVRRQMTADGGRRGRSPRRIAVDGGRWRIAANGCRWQVVADGGRLPRRIWLAMAWLPTAWRMMTSGFRSPQAGDCLRRTTALGWRGRSWRARAEREGVARGRLEARARKRRWRRRRRLSYVRMREEAALSSVREGGEECKEKATDEVRGEGRRRPSRGGRRRGATRRTRGDRRVASANATRRACGAEMTHDRCAGFTTSGRALEDRTPQCSGRTRIARECGMILHGVGDGPLQTAGRSPSSALLNVRICCIVWG